MKSKFTRPPLNIALCFLFVLTICSIGQAQSGRRAPKPLSPPISTAPPAEAEQPAKKKPALKPQTLIVGMDGANGSIFIPLYVSDAIWSGFLESFRKLSHITITADKNMRRKDAIDRAKRQTESFVVLLQLGTQNITAGMGQTSLEDLVVEYIVYSPGTGKVEDQGRVYVRSQRSVLSKRLPTGRSDEAQLNEAGRETAGRVMSVLHMGSTAIRY